MNRKKFITLHGATCDNWTWSWSFVNHSEKEVIFGAWDIDTKNGRTLIFAEDWKVDKKSGKRAAAYGQSFRHIELIINEGYTLKTFNIFFSDEKQDENGVGPSKIDRFEKILRPKKLIREGANFFACEPSEVPIYEETLGDPGLYLEGAAKSITVNAYERNPEARKKCINHWGAKCRVCDFDFGKVYGEIGKDYIHVHHLIPLAMRGEQYEVNPIDDLLPVCPNCHAMLHMDEQPSPGEDKLWKVKALQNAVKLQRR